MSAVASINVKLTPEIEERILNTQTRQCNKVIRELYGHKLSNKELSENVGVSRSALSNILQKIKSSQLGLLVVEQNGRNTYYSLSDLGCAYAEKHLLNDIASSKIINIEEKLSEHALMGIHAIKNMQKEWGEEWQLKFDELLVEHSKGKSGEEHFETFIEAVKNIIIEERWEELNKIYHLIDNVLLRKRIEKRFDRLMGIKCLCIIDDMDWKMAYKLVEDFFEYNGQFVRMEFLEQFQNHQIGSEDVKSAFNALSQMLEAAREEKMSKEDFYNEWEEMFVSHERLVYYIAEKYKAQC